MPPLQPGTRLGPYEILAPLGAGGMGEVWKARDTRLDRVVAIKTVHGPFTDRFEREARAISALNHPHICTLYDVGEHDGAGYLVMEYVEGRPLTGPLPLDQALKYGAQICDALDAAHRKSIVHRDLKPDNILMTKAGVKLLDFGLAKALEPAATGHADSPSAMRREVDASVTRALTGAHVVLGTPQYMAPEQIDGRNADARTDIFAFGCVLYELLTGRKAFDGKTPSSTMAAILATEPRPMREWQPVTPASVERVVKRCLAKDPDDRWQSVRDLQADLEWIAEGGAAPQQTVEPIPATMRRLPWIVAGVLAILAAVTLWAPWRRPPGQWQVSFEILPPENQRVDGPPSISPDGRRVVLMLRDAGGKTSLFMRRLESPVVERIPDTDGASPSSWSPESRYITFFAGGKLKKVDVTGGGPSQTLCECGNPSPMMSWNADGVILISRRDGLSRVPSSGGAPAPVTTLDTTRRETGHDKPQFLPDGRHFLYFARSAQPENSGVYVGSLDASSDGNGRTLVLGTQYNALYARGPSGSGHLLFEREGTLMAQSFDAGTLRLTGEAFPIVQRVGFMGATTLAASVSDTGALVYTSISRGPQANRQFAWFDRAGNRLEDVGPIGTHNDFALSLDDKRLAVSSRDEEGNRDISLLDLDRPGAFRRFTFQPSDETSPVWSPDGSLVFTSNRDAGGLMYRKQAGSVGAERPVTTSPGNPSDWSSDGRNLLYQSHDDLWVLSDGKSVPFARTEFRETLGQFSPDGKWVAFVSDESRRPEVYVQRFPATEDKKPISTLGGTQPRWGQNGKELFYLAPDGTLMAVSVRTTSAGFEYGAPAPLFSTALSAGPSFGYAVGHDSLRFLLLVNARETTATPVTVVTNWLAGVKRE